MSTSDHATASGAMISAQFRIQLPEGLWVAQLSKRFPDATFRLLSGFRMDDRAVELGEITTDAPETVVTAMREHDAIEGFELLESADRRALSRYETTDTALYAFTEASSLTVEFPIPVQNGWYEFDLTATREELDQLRAVLDSSGLPYELRSLVEGMERETLLTDRQRELLEAALREGYFEVPRECTLADLADEIGVDKSSASTVLRRGEARILKQFLTGPDDRRSA
jgi:predicted DNA binding protein